MRRLKRLEFTVREPEKKETHTERYSEMYSGPALSLQLSTDQSMCVRKQPETGEKKKKNTGNKQTKHFLEHTWGWNSSRNLVTHESSG